MNALVVSESMYGNTAAVGEAIAASLRTCGLVAEARLVSEVDPVETADVDLLIVGGPTHVHGMSRSSTRKTAASDERNTFPNPTLEPGLREWLRQLPPGENNRLAAAFDTTSSLRERSSTPPPGARRLRSAPPPIGCWSLRREGQVPVGA